MRLLLPETLLPTLLALLTLVGLGAAFDAPPAFATSVQEGEGPVKNDPAPVQVAPRITEIYSVQHAPVDQLSSLIRIFDITVQPNPALGVIGLHGREPDVRAAMAALERLDVPPEPTRSVQLTLWIVVGAKTPNGGKLPSALEPVTRQLEDALGYEAFELLDTILVRTRNHGGIASDGVLEESERLGGGAGYGMRVDAVEVIPREGGSVVRLTDLAFELRPQPEPGKTTHRTTLITDVEVIEGQKVVVGKATTGPENLGLILVLEAKVE